MWGIAGKNSDKKILNKIDNGNDNNNNNNNVSIKYKNNKATDETGSIKTKLGKQNKTRRPQADIADRIAIEKNCYGKIQLSSKEII
jgi:hypothetical protein